MPTLTLQIEPPQPALALLPEPQLCYLLLTLGASGAGGAHAVNWALVADASRSMRIPIVSEAQFRELLRSGTAQEVLVDGVPVWQLAGPVPPDMRAAAPSALDFVARALHSVVDRLSDGDRFALIACAEEALALTRSTSGADRAALARGIGRLPGLNLGEQTDLAQGIALGLSELRRSRAAERAERLLLLTDGFTQRPDECLRLAAAAAAEGVAISTIGLGGEFQEDVLTAIADRSAGRALFLRKPDAIPQAVGAELRAGRAVAARDATLRLSLAAGTALRRATRMRPALTILDDAIRPAGPPGSYELRLGDLEASAPTTLLLELMAPAHPAGLAELGRCELRAAGTAPYAASLTARYTATPPPAPPSLLDAAARANAARLQLRALDRAAHGDAREAARLLRAAAARFAALNEPALAALASDQAAAIELRGSASALAVKELTYATRRLGEG